MSPAAEPSGNRFQMPAGLSAASGAAPPYRIRLALLHRHNGEQHLACRRKAGGPAKNGPADPATPWRELPWGTAPERRLLLETERDRALLR